MHKRNTADKVVLKKMIAEKLKEGKTATTVINEINKSNPEYNKTIINTYYYNLMKEIRNKWEKDEFMVEVKAWIREQYLNVFEMAIQKQNIKEARQILDSLAKVSGMHVTKNEVTIVDQDIKFKFDIPDIDTPYEDVDEDDDEVVRRPKQTKADAKPKEQQTEKIEIINRLEKEKKVIQKKSEIKKEVKAPKVQAKPKRVNNIDWTKEYENGSYDDDDLDMYF